MASRLYEVGVNLPWTHHVQLSGYVHYCFDSIVSLEFATVILFTANKVHLQILTAHLLI